MPRRLRMIGRYGNGVGALFFASLVLYALGQGDIVIALFWALVCGLAAFNVYMFEKVAEFAVDDERSNSSDPRPAELRRGLASLAVDTSKTVVRHHGS